MAAAAFYGIVGILFTLYLLDAYFCRRRHPQEPPYVRPTIPLIGHVVGLVRHGSYYYEILSHGQPELFTLPILSFRIYVLNSRHLFPVVIRNARTLSFRPFSKLASRVWCNVSEPFMEMHEEGHPYIEDLFRDSRNALAPGEGLDYQNLMTGNSLQRHIEQLDAQVGSNGAVKFALYEWVHSTVTVASSDGVYGKNNPFKDPQIESDYWLWIQAIKKQTINTPRIFMQKELAARDRVFKAFETYWRSDWSDAAEITKARKRLYDRDGVSLEDQGKHQSSFNLALLGNSVPTAFWALYDVISRPQLLVDIRAELEANAVTRHRVEGLSTFDLDVAALRTKCPLLLSAYQETQRTKSVHAMIREVVSDTFIESSTTETTYFLAKGQYVQMPSGPIHRDANIWGPNAAAFDAYRFVKDSATMPKSQMPNSYALLPWGTTPHLCPARQFASTEIMLFVALMVLRFEFQPPDGGPWEAPQPKIGEFATVMPPKNEAYLDISRRSDWQGTWSLKMGESTKRIPLASG